MYIKNFPYWFARSGLTQVELSMRADVSVKSISTLQNNKGRISPRLTNKVLLALSEVLREKGIRQELLELEEDEEEEPAFLSSSRIA